jgi:hypothetical protein
VEKIQFLKRQDLWNCVYNIQLHIVWDRKEAATENTHMRLISENKKCVESNYETKGYVKPHWKTRGIWSSLGYHGVRRASP